MRIIIELDRNGAPLPVTTAGAEASPASDAGGPPDHLLAEIGGAMPDAAPSDVIAAGAPPAWLVQAIEAAMREGDETGTATATGGNADGGAAPDDGGIPPFAPPSERGV
jgi:hypothetical protein